MKLSVCIPVYNGARTIGALVERVIRVSTGRDLEIVLVNDGSRDSSEEVCNSLAERLAPVTAITLRRNFGEHNAVMCALAASTGDYAAIIDDDFQNPPEEIGKLLDEALKGYDVVYSKYRLKKHSMFRNLGSGSQWPESGHRPHAQAQGPVPELLRRWCPGRSSMRS